MNNQFQSIAILMTTLAICACGTAGVGGAESDDDEANMVDALVGTSRFAPTSNVPANSPGTNPVNPQGNMPIDQGFNQPAPSGCVAGTSLGLCSVCGPGGQPQAAPADPNCPPVNCGVPGSYLQAEENADLVCYQAMGMAPITPPCSGIGQCAPQEVACQGVQRIEVARIMGADPCQTLTGCVGQEPPLVMEQPVDAMCNRTGRCQGPDGQRRCNVQVPAYCKIDVAVNAMLFCDAGVEGMKTYCEYFVAPPGGQRTTCDTFCTELGLESCDNVMGESCCWNNANDRTCEKGEGIQCRDNACGDPMGCSAQICRCYRPSQAGGN
ncbi:MAG: hypothetical protein VX589_21700 [Myxococcota bacterium]|nr:hypothetical protein [Myxococcota bacterium]